MAGQSTLAPPAVLWLWVQSRLWLQSRIRLSRLRVQSRLRLLSMVTSDRPMRLRRLTDCNSRLPFRQSQPVYAPHTCLRVQFDPSWGSFVAATQPNNLSSLAILPASLSLFSEALNFRPQLLEAFSRTASQVHRRSGRRIVMQCWNGSARRVCRCGTRSRSSQRVSGGPRKKVPSDCGLIVKVTHTHMHAERAGCAPLCRSVRGPKIEQVFGTPSGVSRRSQRYWHVRVGATKGLDT